MTPPARDSKPDKPMMMLVSANALEEAGTGQPERDPHESGPEPTNRDLVQSTLSMTRVLSERVEQIEKTVKDHAEEDKAHHQATRDELREVRTVLGDIRDELRDAKAKAELAKTTADRVETAHDADIAARTAKAEKATEVLIETGVSVAKDAIAARGDKRKIIASILGGGAALTALVELVRILAGG